MVDRNVEEADPSTVTEETLTSLRLPKPLLDRAEALVAKLKKKPEFAVQRITRSTVIRLALMRGLDALEAEHRLQRKRKQRQR